MRLSCGCALVRGVKDASGRVWCVYHDRLAWVDDEGAAPIDAEVTLLDQSLIDAQHTLAQLTAQIGTVAKQAEAKQSGAAETWQMVRRQADEIEKLRKQVVRAENSSASRAARIAELETDLLRTREQFAPDARTVARCRLALAALYRAPITMSSLQPLLDLAVELTPGLKASGRPNVSADELGKCIKQSLDDMRGKPKEDR